MKVQYSKKAIKALQKIPLEQARSIHEEIGALEENPLPKKAKKLTDKNIYRLRKGDYRVLYVLTEQTILIANVDKRSRAYKR